MQFVESIEASINDPDIESIKVQFKLKPGKTVEGLSVLMYQRALLKYVGDNVTSWAQYCLDTDFRKFGHVDPIFKEGNSTILQHGGRKWKLVEEK